MINSSKQLSIFTEILSSPQTLTRFIQEFPMKSLFTTALVAATLVSLSLPATAGQKTVTGPKGGTATGSGAIVPNRQGGYSGTGQGSFQGANGASGSAQGQFKSNGQGTVNYQGSGTVTTPQGTTYNATTNGNGSYDEENGYSGQNTTTVNGNTYSSNTANGSSTVTTPKGTKTFTRPNLRR
jgi:hypothetical protein